MLGLTAIAQVVKIVSNVSDVPKLLPNGVSYSWFFSHLIIVWANKIHWHTRLTLFVLWAIMTAYFCYRILCNFNMKSNCRSLLTFKVFPSPSFLKKFEGSSCLEFRFAAIKRDPPIIFLIFPS